ncbi:hypothetical protein UlMin_022664 [Ulmus minor]
MENDNLGNEDDRFGSNSGLQWNDLGFPVVRNESADSSRITNAAVANNVGIPHTLVPQSYSGEIPLGFDSTAFRTSLNTGNRRYSNDDNQPIQPSPFSNFPYTERNMAAPHQFHTFGYPMAPDNMANAATRIGGLQNPYMNNHSSIVNDNSASSLQMNNQAGDFYMPQSIRNFVGEEGNTPAFFHIPDVQELGTNNNFTINAAQSNFQQIPDGSFLTLGTGHNVERIHECNISGRDIGNISSNNNPRVVLPQMNMQGQNARNLFNTGSNMAGSLSSFQNNVPGFHTVTQNVDGWSFPNNNQRITSGVNSGLIFNPYSIEDTPLINEAQYSSMPSNRFGCENVGNSDVCIDPDNGFLGYSSMPSFPLGNSHVGLLDPAQSRASQLQLTSRLSGRNYAQAASDQSHKAYMGAVRNFSSEISLSPPIRETASMSLQDETDQAIPVTNVNRISQASNILMGSHRKRGATQSSLATLRSQRRRGGAPHADIAIHAPAQSASLLPNSSEIASVKLLAHDALPLPHQAKSNIRPSPLSQTARAVSLLPQTASSLQPQSQPLSSQFPSQSLVNPQQNQPWTSQSFSSQQWVAPSSSPQPRTSIAPSFNPQPGTASPFPPRPRTASPFPPLPRTAPPCPPLSLPQPRTTPPRTLRPQTAPSKQYRPRTALPPLPTRTDSPSSYIMRQGVDETPKLLGQKCFLCKRDLAYTPPDDPVSIPPVPPHVAVLPCQHTFHDHCLQLITPPEEAKNPPCIPCAVGEN